MKRTSRLASLLLLAALLGGGAFSAGAAEGYRQPPAAVLDVLNAAPTPMVRDAYWALHSAGAHRDVASIFRPDAVEPQGNTLMDFTSAYKV